MSSTYRRRVDERDEVESKEGREGGREKGRDDVPRSHARRLLWFSRGRGGLRRLHRGGGHSHAS